jgi:hypothetical protein
MTEIWWRLRCDHGHSWDVRSEQAEEPPDDAVICPVDGTEAVTATTLEPADRVRLCLVPAARVLDRVKGTVERDGTYFLEWSSADGARTLRSADVYDMDEAFARMRLFVRDTWDEAVARMRRLRLVDASE